MRPFSSKFARLAACLLAASALTLAGCGSNSNDNTASSGRTKVNFGTFPGTLQDFPPYLADKEGFFKKHGLDVTFTNFTTGPDLATALITGSTDISDEGLSIIWPLLKKGEKMISLTGGLMVNYALIAGTDVKLKHAGEPFPKNLLDLKGKKIGVSSHGSLNESFVTGLAEAAGLDPKKDIQIITTGSVPTAITSLKRGQTDMQVAFPPLAQTMGEPDKDYQVVADMLDGPTSTGDVMKGQLGDTYAANESWLKSNPDAAKSFCAAIEDTLAFAADSANAAKVNKALGTWANLEPDLAASVWKTFGSTFQPKITPELWKTQAQFGLANSKGFEPDYSDYVYGPCQ